MWTPLDVPIEVSRNGTTPIGLQIWDEISGEPVDLTDCVVSCRVSETLGSPPRAIYPIDPVDLQNGEFDILIDGGALSGIGGANQIVRMAYEIKSESGGITVTVMRGPLILIPGI